MAANEQGFRDEDGDRPDWIELYNAGSSAASLTGWHLTDDADRLLGDMDLNGQVDGRDIDALLLGLNDAAAYEQRYGVPAAYAGDFDADGDVDSDDIRLFVRLLLAGKSPADD